MSMTLLYTEVDAAFLLTEIEQRAEIHEILCGKVRQEHGDMWAGPNRRVQCFTPTGICLSQTLY